MGIRVYPLWSEIGYGFRKTWKWFFLFLVLFYFSNIETWEKTAVNRTEMTSSTKYKF